MRFCIIICSFFLVSACQAQTGQPPAKTGEITAEVATLKWNLRDALRMQLPLTWPEEKDGREVKKSYSFDIPKDASTMWEIPEKLHDAETEQLFGGGKYLLSFEDIDLASIRIVPSPDNVLAGIVIKAKKGRSFVYDPYKNGPDERVAEVRLGWWDHVQDLTLDRVLALMQELSAAMNE